MRTIGDIVSDTCAAGDVKIVDIFVSPATNQRVYRYEVIDVGDLIWLSEDDLNDIMV